jgi:hypothetical protein
LRLLLVSCTVKDGECSFILIGSVVDCSQLLKPKRIPTEIPQRDRYSNILQELKERGHLDEFKQIFQETQAERVALLAQILTERDAQVEDTEESRDKRIAGLINLASVLEEEN